MPAPGQDRQNTQSFASIASATKEAVKALAAINDNLVLVGQMLKSWLDTAVDVEPITELKVVSNNLDEENPQKRWIPLVVSDQKVGEASIEMEDGDFKITDIRVTDEETKRRLFDPANKTEPLNLSADDVDEIWDRKPPRADPRVWPSPALTPDDETS